MEQIKSELGGDQCLTVSANQCTASNACQNRYTFTLTSKAVCGEPDPCNGGGLCHEQGERALCKTPNGITTQVCCGSQWKVGALNCD